MKPYFGWALPFLCLIGVAYLAGYKQGQYHPKPVAYYKDRCFDGSKPLTGNWCYSESGWSSSCAKCLEDAHASNGELHAGPITYDGKPSHYQETPKVIEPWLKSIYTDKPEKVMGWGCNDGSRMITGHCPGDKNEGCWRVTKEDKESNPLEMRCEGLDGYFCLYSRSPRCK